MGGVTGKRDGTRGVLPRVPSLFLLRATPLPPLRGTSRNHVSRRRFPRALPRQSAKGASAPFAFVWRPCRRAFSDKHFPLLYIQQTARAGPLRFRSAALPPRILRDSPAGESLPVLGVREGEFPPRPHRSLLQIPQVSKPAPWLIAFPWPDCPRRVRPASGCTAA